MSEVMELPDNVLSILRPPPKLTVSQWCDRNRVLDAKFSARPGQWRTAETPHIREPLDSLTDAQIATLLIVACAQGAKTEFGNNCLAFLADSRPVPALYVRPTEPEINEVFGEDGRFRRLFMSGDALPRHIPGGNWASNDTLHLDTMNIYGAWTSSPNTLTSRPIGFCYFDEVDNCERSEGRLGNHWRLCKERGLTWGYRFKMVGSGTPDGRHDTLWQEYEASDAREYWEPCPLCGVYQPLAFDRIEVPKEIRDPQRITLDRLAWYRCKGCEGQIDQRWQVWMADRGRWVPRDCSIEEKLDLKDEELVKRRSLECAAPELRWQPVIKGTPKRTNQRGYRFWRANLRWDTSSWSHIIAEHLSCGQDPGRRKVFANAWLAEPWEEAVETADIDVLRTKPVRGLPVQKVPDRAKLLLMGADVQPDYFFWDIHAWGPNEESWLIDSGRAFTFDELYRIAFFTGFERIGKPAERMTCLAMIIDSRHRQAEVYQFAQRPGVKLCHGVQKAPYRWRPGKIDYYPRGGTKKLSLIDYAVNTSLYKEKAHALAMLPAGHASEWHLNTGTTDEYLQHVTNEHQVPIRTKGKNSGRVEWVWQPRTEHARVDWLDTRVYGLALADMINVPLLREDSEVMPGLQALMTTEKPKTAPPQGDRGGRWSGPRGGGGPGNRFRR